MQNNQITPDDRKELREKIGAAVLSAQDDQRRAGKAVESVLVEIVCALLSLSALICHHNMNNGPEDFKQACEAAAQEQWPT